jgi:hypothetical protein
MKTFIVSVFISVTLLGPVEAGASQLWLINGGSKGTNGSSIGIEGGGTKAIMNLLPLSAELSLKSTFDLIPPDINFNTNKLNGPYTIKKLNNGPVVGNLFVTGINLNDSIPNLTLQLGGGYALQKAMNITANMVSGTQWQQGSKPTGELPVGYVGLLYRLKNIGITAGYNTAGDNAAGYKNQRGMILGIGRSW